MLTIPPNVKYADLFVQLQREARENGRRLWGLLAPVPTPPAATSQTKDDCDPSYPDVCIPPYPPDLNCKDVPYKRFRVLSPDPHGFDRDKDGVGCES